jgi:chemotaxis protein methyltransferase CheR
MAKICSDKGEFGKAVELCRKGIETDKCNPIYNFLLALIFKEQGKTGEAISSLKRAIYLDSDHALSFYVLGNILFQQGDRKNAIKYFNNALSILDRIDKEMILPGSDGLSAGRLAEIIKMKDMQDKTAYGLNITDGK